MFYSAEIRTLHLSHKIYQEFETFLKQELSQKTFKNLKFNQNPKDPHAEFENKATLILEKFQEIFLPLTYPNGELEQLIKIVDNEINELEKYENSPQTMQQKIKEMSEISAEEKVEEMLENQIIQKIQQFLKETNLTKKEIKKLSQYIKQLASMPKVAGEKLEEQASLFALTVVSLGLISSIGGALGLPGVAIFGSLFSSVAFGGELLQSIPWLDKKLTPIYKNFLNNHKSHINKLEQEKEEIKKLNK